MINLDTFESRISVVMKALVETAVAELGKLLTECSANAVAAQHRSAAAPVTAVKSEVTPPQEEQPQFFKDVTRHFASLMEASTISIMEEILMMLKVSTCKAPPAEQRTELHDDTKQTSTSPRATQISEPSEETKTRKLHWRRRKIDEAKTKANDHLYCRVEQQAEGPTARTADSEPETEPADAASCEESNGGPQSEHHAASPEPDLQESDVSDGDAVQEDVPSKAERNKKTVGPIKCPSCDKTFAKKCLLVRHYLVHTKPIVCSECGKRFAMPGGLRAHVRKHTGEKLYRCSDCGTEFAYKSTYHRHMLNYCINKPVNPPIKKPGLQLPSKTFTCVLCERHFSGKVAFERHRCCALKKTFVCSLCPETFDCRQSLADHENLHSGDRDFICEMCGDGFLSSSSLATHRVTHMQKENCCDELGLGCSDISVLKNHLCRHTGEKMFTCEVCGKGCSHQSALKHHMLTHTGERPYVCETCGKRCGHPSALQNHMRVHTGRKPGQKPVCEVCGKTVPSLGKLKRHMKAHTGERPYHCDQCGKDFSDAGNLKVHMMIHSAKKMYGCNVCGKRFAQSTGLKQHRRLHEGEMRYHCKVCGKRFLRSVCLRKHEKTHLLEEGGDKQTEETAGKN